MRLLRKRGAYAQKNGAYASISERTPRYRGVRTRREHPPGHRLACRVPGGDTADPNSTGGGINEAFKLVPTKDQSITFQFKPRQHLRDESGFNFNLFIHYALCVVLFTARGGVVKQGYRLIELAYRNTGLCEICFGKNKTTDGRPACKKGEDCPFVGCCKLCWQYIPTDMFPREHVLEHCAVFKELLAKNPAILPSLAEVESGFPTLALDPAKTNSVTGKRSLTEPPPENPPTVANDKKSRKLALLARRSRERYPRRPPSSDEAGPSGPVTPSRN